MKKIIGIITTGAVAMSMLCSSAFCIKADAAVNYDRLCNQSPWKGSDYQQELQQAGSSKYVDALDIRGCGIFAIANSVYCLNGEKINVDEVADWAVRNDAWSGNNKGGTNRYIMFGDKGTENVADAFGKEYNFKIVGTYKGKIDDDKLITHLENGGTAVVHVQGHFMAVAGYDDGEYFVIDSAPGNGSGKRHGLEAVQWLTAKKLYAAGRYVYVDGEKVWSTTVDWYCLIDTRDGSKTADTYAANTGSSYFTKYTGSSGSLVDALNSIDAKSDSEYRTEIAKVNGIDNYTKSASQNTKLLNLLKEGKLIKPGSVSYFTKYSGSSGSLVDALKSIGEKSDFKYRSDIAKANGINDYSGTSPQNKKLLNLLKDGKLIKP